MTPASSRAPPAACRLKAGDALIVIDVQADFLPGGALGIREAHQIVAPLNRCIAKFHQRGLPVFATRDWHPPDHCSFHAAGGPWPAHCVAGTAGAQFAPGLQLPQDACIISKAMSREADAYSGFQGTDLLEQLHRCGCARAFIGGLATDYCVRATALDAVNAGLAVIVLTDLVRAVDAHPGDGERALAELMSRGVQLSTTEELS